MFKYKPGKLNSNADALSRNPVDCPEEEEINQQLPQVKIMVIETKNTKKMPEKSEKKTTKATPFAEQHKAGPSGLQSPRPTKTSLARSRGRPVGATTRKTGPPLDHSVIAQQTCNRLTLSGHTSARPHSGHMG